MSLMLGAESSKTGVKLEANSLFASSFTGKRLSHRPAVSRGMDSHWPKPVRQTNQVLLDRDLHRVAGLAINRQHNIDQPFADQSPRQQDVDLIQPNETTDGERILEQAGIE